MNRPTFSDDATRRDYFRTLGLLGAAVVGGNRPRRHEPRWERRLDARRGAAVGPDGAWTRRPNRRRVDDPDSPVGERQAPPRNDADRGERDADPNSVRRRPL